MKTYLIVLASAILLLSNTPSFGANRSDGPIVPLRVGVNHSSTGPILSADREWDVAPRSRSLLEPTLFVMAFHAVGMGMLVSMDPAETGFKPMHVRNWVDGLSKAPILDDDSWITNYVLHPLWGSETYLRARCAAYNPLEAFLFSTAASVIWEYGFEAWAEHPSIQDLLITSTVGSALGELRYAARVALMSQDAAWATVLLVLVDPLNVFVKYSGHLLGGASQRISSALASSVSLDPAPSVAAGGDSGSVLALRLAVDL